MMRFLRVIPRMVMGSKSFIFLPQSLNASTGYGGFQYTTKQVKGKKPPTVRSFSNGVFESFSFPKGKVLGLSTLVLGELSTLCLPLPLGHEMPCRGPEGVHDLFDIPEAHCKAIRTTNLLERIFGEDKRRTKVVPRFPTESSGLRLPYLNLITASRSWRSCNEKHLQGVVHFYNTGGRLSSNWLRWPCPETCLLASWIT